jgi:hypothetical protein
MKKHYKFNIIALLILALITISSAVSAQEKDGVSDTTPFAADLRPFDFSDRHYAANGIYPSQLLNRRNGADGFSVIDYSSERNHNNVRILATQTAYGPDGEKLFWNFYAEFHKTAFTPDNAGMEAYNLALESPIFTFPSTNRKGGDRQSPVIEVAKGYFEKNVLGLGIVMVVEYDLGDLSREDAAYLEAMAKRNGRSADGTPIIRTTKEIGQLQRRNLVSVNIRQSDDASATPFIVGRVIQFPDHGAIAPDAFLIYTKNTVGKPLDSEMFFIDSFECVKSGKSGCLN